MPKSLWVQQRRTWHSVMASHEARYNYYSQDVQPGVSTQGREDRPSADGRNNPAHQRNGGRK